MPKGSVLGYIDGVSSVLGKLIIVQANIGVCGGTESPTATIGHSVLWCEERVCVKKTVSGVTPVKALVKTKINIFDDTYMVLSQAEYGDPKKPEPNLYMTGIKDIAILANGVLAEAKTCMPLISANGTNISISRPPISIGVSHNAELVMDDAVYAEIALVSVLNPEDLESISEGVLPIGIKRPVQVEREYVDINESALKIRIIEPLSGSENVCVDNVLQDTLVLLR